MRRAVRTPKGGPSEGAISEQRDQSARRGSPHVGGAGGKGLRVATGQLKRGKSAVVGASGVERAGGQPEACCACPGQGRSSGCRWRGGLSRRRWCALRATCCIGSLRPATRRGRTPRSSTARLGQLSESAATSGLCDRAGLPGAGRPRPTTGAGAERDGHCASRGRVTVSSRRTRGRLLRQGSPCSGLGLRRSTRGERHWPRNGRGSASGRDLLSCLWECTRLAGDTRGA